MRVSHAAFFAARIVHFCIFPVSQHLQPTTATITIFYTAYSISHIIFMLFSHFVYNILTLQGLTKHCYFDTIRQHSALQGNLRVRRSLLPVRHRSETFLCDPKNDSNMRDGDTVLDPFFLIGLIAFIMASIGVRTGNVQNGRFTIFAEAASGMFPTCPEPPCPGISRCIRLKKGIL